MTKSLSTIPEADQTLVHAFEDKARTNPQSVFAKFPKSFTSYKEGFRSVTYAQLANAVNYAARFIDDNFGKSTNFETLAYIGPSDLRYVVALLAGIKTGYKVFLPSPRNSKAAQLALFTKLECKKLLCTSTEVPCIPMILEDFHMQKLQLISFEEMIDMENVPRYPYDKTYEEEKDNTIFVLHTSGSTGIPKPLIYSNDIVTRAVRAVAISAPEGFQMVDYPFRPGPFFAFFPLFHLAGLYWASVLPIFFDMIPVRPLSGTPPTTQGLVEALQYVECDYAVTPPIVIDELGQNPSLLDAAASKLKYIAYGGGAVHQATGDIVNARLPLYQVLGSSENAAAPLILPLDYSGEDWNYMQLHPGAGGEFRHRLENLYELVYVKSAKNENHQPLFLHLPSNTTEWASKDLFSPHPSKPGLWKHQSRSDDVIVFITGEKTNPVSFEEEVSDHPEVRSALVAGHLRFETALIIELMNPVEMQRKEDMIEKIWPTIQSANCKCPAHAQVSKTRILFTDPSKPFARAGKGTVIRMESIRLYDKELEDLFTQDDLSDMVKEHKIEDKGVVVQTIHDCVQELIGITDLDNTQDFFHLGMDSLQVLQLGRKLQHKFKSEALRTSTIYANPTVNLLAKAILVPSADNQDQTASNTGQVGIVRTQFEKAIDGLAETVDTSRRKSEVQHDKVVILTGSTGAIGSYILLELLNVDSVSHIYCLNRSSDSTSVQVFRNKERGLFCDFPHPKVTFLTANLGKPAFGLEMSVYNAMSSTVTHIIHNAWPVNFNKTLQSFQPSLEGVLGILAFAAKASSSPAVFFLSSIGSALNYHNSTVKTKASVPDIVLMDDSVPPSMGYGQSKYIAERMLDYAARKLNLVTASVRIGQVAGPVESSAMWNKQEWFPSLVLSSQYMNALPNSLGSKSTSDLQGSMSNIDWIPIDRLSCILVELAFGLDRAGSSSSGSHVYHAVNPRSVAWETFLPAVKETLRKTTLSKSDVEIISYEEWVKRLQSSGTVTNGEAEVDTNSDMVKKNPGVKLLDFYQSLIGSENEEGVQSRFEVERTSSASQALRDLEPIKQQWMSKWIEKWFST